MAKYEIKTKLNDSSVEDFLDSVENEGRKVDAKLLCSIMEKVSGESPKMWGSSIIGFGSYHYKGKSGGEGEWMSIGLSPRKQNLSVYISAGFEINKDLLPKLGKHKTGVGCLYLNKLSDVDTEVLTEMIQRGFNHFKKQ